MKLTTRTKSTAFAFAAVGGVSTLFLGATPAYAATEACGPTGDLIAPGICEQTFTSGTATFTPTAQMTTLEVLLVGAGGSGADQPVPNSNGYAAAGGGGEVKIVDLTGATDPIDVTVSEPGVTGGVADGLITETVANGADAADDSLNGGASGSGNPGDSGDTDDDPAFGAGAGAGSSPVGTADGGAGVVVSSIAPVGSLFVDDARCFGGGGAIGIPADYPTLGEPAILGMPGCGAGGPDEAATALIAAATNSGGGGGGILASQSAELRAGADGFVAFRWNAANVTLAFDVNGHGTAPASQSVVAGTAGTQPDEPSAEGYQFDGWYLDEQFTTVADFSVPLTASTTVYAKWTQILVPTGYAPDSAQLPIGIAALIAGAGLVTIAAVRKRRES